MNAITLSGRMSKGDIAAGDGNHRLVDELRVLAVDGLVVDRAVVQKTVVGSFALHSNPSLLKKYIIFWAF